MGYAPSILRQSKHPTNSQNDDDNERMNPDGEMEVVTADAVRDSSDMNLNNGGENSVASCVSTSSSRSVQSTL